MKILQTLQQTLSYELQWSEQVCKQELKKAPPSLQPLLTSYFSMPRKQMRPILVLLAHAVWRAVDSAAMQYSAAVEYLHTASLIQDDLIDNGSYRRGAPCFHLQFGLPSAILASNWLVLHALRLCEGLSCILPRRLVLYAAKQLIQGECWQQSSSGGYAVDAESYQRLNMQKSGVLFCIAGIGGAWLACPNNTMAKHFYRYGRSFGFLWQLIDDSFDKELPPQLSDPQLRALASFHQQQMERALQLLPSSAYKEHLLSLPNHLQGQFEALQRL